MFAVFAELGKDDDELLSEGIVNHNRSGIHTRGRILAVKTVLWRRVVKLHAGFGVDWWASAQFGVNEWKES